MILQGERKYYLIIIFVALILFITQQFQREPTSYERTYSHLDKNPYGGYVLKELLPDFLQIEEIESVNLTLYEIQDRLGADVNLLTNRIQRFYSKPYQKE